MWYEQFVRFHQLRHPQEMSEREISAFLKHLCVDRDVAAATHNQALNALVFPYREVLKMELKDIEKHRPRRKKRVPVVLGVDEVRTVINSMNGLESVLARHERGLFKQAHAIRELAMCIQFIPCG